MTRTRMGRRHAKSPDAGTCARKDTAAVDLHASKTPFPGKSVPACGRGDDGRRGPYSHVATIARMKTELSAKPVIAAIHPRSTSLMACRSTRPATHPARYCFSHLVPFDHSIDGPKTTPSMFHGPPTLSVVSLVSCAVARSPLSLAISSVRSRCVTVNVAPERHGSGCGSQRYLPPSSGAAFAAPIEIRPAASTTTLEVVKNRMAVLPCEFKESDGPDCRRADRSDTARAAACAANAQDPVSVPAPADRAAAAPP